MFGWIDRLGCFRFVCVRVPVRVWSEGLSQRVEFQTPFLTVVWSNRGSRLWRRAQIDGAGKFSSSAALNCTNSFAALTVALGRFGKTKNLCLATDAARTAG
ncbi:MAG: hypothetical protein DWI00_08860 [Planctomycetota bacterium]|nr:MAG: hypothetical protein DWI00_08860 [Planctomycetota bacterium]